MIEVLRFLHDAMDLQRHLPPAEECGLIERKEHDEIGTEGRNRITDTRIFSGFKAIFCNVYGLPSLVESR